MKILSIFSWLVVLWIAKVFLFSLPYKFTLHPDTQHIFGSIGAWMQAVIAPGLGRWFSSYGAYAVGAVELVISLLLLLPALFFVLAKLGVMQSSHRAFLHAWGGLMAAMVMTGAVFFHLFTPLGVEVIHEGKSDGGSLFYAALSILVLGIVMFISNYRSYQQALRTTP